MGKRDLACEERWRRTIAEWASSGLTAKAFSADRGLSVNSLYSWRRELRRRDGERDSSGMEGTSASRFVQLRVEPAPSSVEIDLGSALVMRIPASLDEPTMIKIITATRKAAAC